MKDLGHLTALLQQQLSPLGTPNPLPAPTARRAAKRGAALLEKEAELAKKQAEAAQSKLKRLQPAAKQPEAPGSELKRAAAAVEDAEAAAKAARDELAVAQKELESLFPQQWQQQQQLYELPGGKQQTKQPQQRIAVFIDDLDRCKPTKVVEVLEAINSACRERLLCCGGRGKC